jgi:hypothetical protein
MSRSLTSVLGLIVATSLITLVNAAGDEDVFELQPEIHHVFREAEKMPPAAFSQLFTLITLAPWIVLVAGVSLVST